MGMRVEGCVVCSVKIAGSDVYLRPGDGSSVCVKCFHRADRRSLEPPRDPRGTLRGSSGSSESAARDAADLLIDLLTD